MVNWFKRYKSGNLTFTQSSKGTTWSRSSGSKNSGYRVRDVHTPGGKMYRVTTRRSGGRTSIQRAKW